MQEFAAISETNSEFRKLPAFWVNRGVNSTAIAVCCGKIPYGTEQRIYWYGTANAGVGTGTEQRIFLPRFSIEAIGPPRKAGSGVPMNDAVGLFCKMASWYRRTAQAEGRCKLYHVVGLSHSPIFDASCPRRSYGRGWSCLGRSKAFLTVPSAAGKALSSSIESHTGHRRGRGSWCERASRESFRQAHSRGCTRTRYRDRWPPVRGNNSRLGI